LFKKEYGKHYKRFTGLREALDQCRGKVLGGSCSTKVSGTHIVLKECGAYGVTQASGKVALSNMVEHQSCSEQERNGIGYAFSCDIRRRSMYRFEYRGVFADVCTRREP
jgi:hypothetical protein